ncbi:DUF6350 family protein [Brachybacterium endophyticum]|uniref:cell division protein PerM n=1 Tax=Brachybacterium endophyticum TaxID=2182385 RepID=UPI0010579599|nr:DUF6350 family protein [Brachybacterium endophyticum]
MALNGGREVRIDAPMISGAIAALGALASGVALTVVPALIAEIGASRSSPGTLRAILMGLDALVLGHGGSVVLQAGSVTGSISLMPVGLTLVLLALITLAARRATRRLRPVDADGALRARAFRDGGACLGALVIVYTAGLGVLAAIARGTLVHAVVPSAIVSGALIAVIGSLTGGLLALRRPAAEGRPAVRVLALLPSPYDAVARALLLTLAGFAASGALLTVVMIGLRFGHVASLHQSLDPGVLGSLVLFLLQLALLPLIMAWVLVILLGGSITLGAGSVISLGGASTPVMPALPLLGIVPEPGKAPGVIWLLVALPVAAVVLGAVRLCRDLAGADIRGRLTALGVFAGSLVVLTLLIAGLVTGGIGDGALDTLGPQLGSLALPLLGIVALPTAAVAAVYLTPALDWLHRTRRDLRERVEESESRESDGGGTAEESERTGTPEGTGTAEKARPAEHGLRSPSDPPSS